MNNERRGDSDLINQTLGECASRIDWQMPRWRPSPQLPGQNRAVEDSIVRISIVAGTECLNVYTVSTCEIRMRYRREVTQEKLSVTLGPTLML